MTKQQNSRHSSRDHSTSTVVEDGEVLVRKRKSRRRQRRNRRIRRIILVVVIVVVVVAGVAFGLNYMTQSAANKVKDANNSANVTVASTVDDGKTITYNGHKYQLNENMVSILLIGHDVHSVNTQNMQTQADMVAVMAMDTSTGKITIINIPRDSMVAVDTYGIDSDGERTDYVGQVIQQLCLAYSYGTGYDSIDNVRKSVERIMYNLPMTYYLDLDFDGIAELTNAVGGVTVEALETIPNTNIVEGETITLLGSNAEKYVQWRDTSESGTSLTRQQRQSQFMKEFVRTAFKNAGGNAGWFVNLFNVAQEYSTTNIDANLVLYLGQCAINNGISMADMITLTGTLDSSGDHDAYYLDDANTTKVVVDTYYKQID